MNKEEDEDFKPDFSFKDIHDEIDKAIDEKKNTTKEKEFKIEHLSDRVRFAKEIKEKPPVKDFMKIEAKDAEIVTTDENGDEKHKKAIAIISNHEEKDKDGKVKAKRKIALYDGIFSIDLNVDAYWWFVRSCNVFPTILDQGIRTHLDIKKAHEPEKRKLEFPWALIGLVACGIFLIFLIFSFLTRSGGA